MEISLFYKLNNMIESQHTCYIVLHSCHHFVWPKTPQDTKQLHAGQYLIILQRDGLLLRVLRLKYCAPLLDVVWEEVHQMLQGEDSMIEVKQSGGYRIIASIEFFIHRKLI